MAAAGVTFVGSNATAGDLAKGNAASLKRELREWMDAFQNTNGRGMPHPSLPLYLRTGSVGRAHCESSQ